MSIMGKCYRSPGARAVINCMVCSKPQDRVRMRTNPVLADMVVKIARPSYPSKIKRSQLILAGLIMRKKSTQLIGA